MKWLWALIAVIIIVGIGIWALTNTSVPASQTASSTSTAQGTETADILPGVPNDTYTNAQFGFSIQYPDTATSSPIEYDGYLPVTKTSLASFTLPSSMFAGTNLGEAGVYIGATTSPSIVATCTEPSVDNGENAAVPETVNGTTFSIATSTGVGAGNIYQETAYRTVQRGACLEIVELLHSGNIGNYTPGTVTQFDYDQFSTILENIVHTYHAL